jgi:hypothetical protein
MKKVFPLSSFVFRHFVASVVSIVTPVIVWFIAYFVLFLVALFTNSTLGGPIALPGLAVLIFVTSVIYTSIFLFPSVSIAEITSRNLGRWQHIAQIPISTLALFVLIYISSQVARHLPIYNETHLLSWAESPFIVFLILAIPLGLYWWTMKAVQAGLSIPVGLFKRMKEGADIKAE